MTQLLCHLWGDYILQSDWMAQYKTKNSLPCAIHALIYSLGFLLLRPSIPAFAVILGTHFLIDRWRLARYVVWAKNWLGPFYEKVVIRFDRNGNAEFQDEQWRRKNPTPDFSECVATAAGIFRHLRCRMCRGSRQEGIAGKYSTEVRSGRQKLTNHIHAR